VAVRSELTLYGDANGGRNHSRAAFRAELHAEIFPSGNLTGRSRTSISAAKKPPRFVNDAGPPGDSTMLWTITIILFVLWVVGLVSGYTLGAWIHVLLVLAVIMLIFNLLQGRRAL